MGLLRLGVAPDEIRTLIEGKSKFRDNPKYLETTIRNALKTMRE